MKKGIHPENYRLVAFKDMSNNDVFITKSAVETKDSIKVDGVDYPLVKLEISRTSHPYYTGKTKLVDTAGRIDKFKNRYAGLSLKNQKSTNENFPVFGQIGNIFVSFSLKSKILTKISFVDSLL